jgi:HAD superfamily hydrolase (TIGR01490 family)
MSDQKKFACFDVDGTIFRSSLLIQLVDVLIERGSFPESAREVFADKHREWLERKGDYGAYLKGVVQVFTTHLGGLPMSTLDEAAGIVIERQKDHVYRYTRDLTKSLKEQGYFLLAISHSPKIILDKFCGAYGFDKVYGTRYSLDEKGLFVPGETFDIELLKDKAAIVARACETEGLSREESVGVGDSESDIPMLESVTHPVCFNPNAKLLAHAKEHGWTVVVERKDVIYEVAGNAQPHLKK